MAPLTPAILQQLRFTNSWLFGGGEALVAHVQRRRPPQWIARTQVDETRFAEVDRAHLLVGPRQAGKSSLVWNLIGERFRRPLFINLEEARMRLWCASAAELLASLQDLGDPVDLVFLEEAQWLDNVGLLVKGLVDHKPGFPIVVTGSASFQLRARTRESLAGRATRHQLLPLGLAEVAPAVGASAAQVELDRGDALARMLYSGGYPAAHLSDAPERVLVNLLESFVFRNASDLFNVDRLDAFDALLRLAARQTGSLVNLAEWAALCGVSADTVRRYLAMMEDAHIIQLVPAFSGGKRREVTSARKAYFLDSGLRQVLLGTREPDAGPRTENFVFTELKKALPWSQVIRYWRTRSGAEVDFVLPRQDRLLGVEVKASALNRPRLARSSRSFIDAYAPSEFWVLNGALRAEDTLGKTRVRWVRLHDLPELVAAWM